MELLRIRRLQSSGVPIGIGGLDNIENINIVAYEPAFGIIGDPAKKDSMPLRACPQRYLKSTMRRVCSQRQLRSL
eukprot:4835532-Amphidinium_carterae.1